MKPEIWRLETGDWRLETRGRRSKARRTPGQSVVFVQAGPELAIPSVRNRPPTPGTVTRSYGGLAYKPSMLPADDFHMQGFDRP